jgi:hypothetical protein
VIPRLQLFEFNDQGWLPQFMIAWMTRILRHCHEVTEDGRVWAPKLLELIQRTGETRIVDLCSGGGGPVLQMAKMLKELHGVQVHVTLTDLIPNLQSAAEINQQYDNVVYLTDAISACDVPNSLLGIRTSFSGFHHMKPDCAFALLKNAFDHRQTIFIGETTSRSWKSIRCYAGTAFHFAEATKHLDPTPSQELFAIRAPILPAMLGWDNVISCLRTYSARELQAFIERLKADDYVWEMGTLCNPKLCLRYPYLMGYPTSGSDASARA